MHFIIMMQPFASKFEIPKKATFKRAYLMRTTK